MKKNDIVVGLLLCCILLLTIQLSSFLKANTLRVQWETIWYQYNMQDMLYEQEGGGTKFTPVSVGLGDRGI